MTGEDFTVRAPNDLNRVVAGLKAAGEGGKGLKKEIAKELRGTAKPVTSAIRRNLGSTMPKGGGLAALLGSKAKTTVRNRLSGRDASVHLVTSWSGHDLPAVDQGALRHPVYGNRGTWVSQGVPAGEITKAVESQLPEVASKIDAAINTTIQKLEKGLP